MKPQSCIADPFAQVRAECHLSTLADVGSDPDARVNAMEWCMDNTGSIKYGRFLLICFRIRHVEEGVDSRLFRLAEQVYERLNIFLREDYLPSPMCGL